MDKRHSFVSSYRGSVRGNPLFVVAIALPRTRCTLAFMSTPPTANYKV
nr:MAG TPA: hypothetical protein [Caudoviricetes sp.]